jgi:transposase
LAKFSLIGLRGFYLTLFYSGICLLTFSHFIPVHRPEHHPAKQPRHTLGACRYLKPHLPVSALGRPREVSLRQVISAILYSLKTGCQWRQLLREFSAWTAVYYYFRQWSSNGTWARLHHLLHARLRQKGGRHKHPTAGCMDSQSVKCTTTCKCSRVQRARIFKHDLEIKGNKKGLG